MHAGTLNVEAQLLCFTANYHGFPRLLWANMYGDAGTTPSKRHAQHPQHYTTKQPSQQHACRQRHCTHKHWLHCMPTLQVTVDVIIQLLSVESATLQISEQACTGGT